jgi:hypothetical protein
MREVALDRGEGLPYRPKDSGRSVLNPPCNLKLGSPFGGLGNGSAQIGWL